MPGLPYNFLRRQEPSSDQTDSKQKASSEHQESQDKASTSEPSSRQEAGYEHGGSTDRTSADHPIGEPEATSEHFESRKGALTGGKEAASFDDSGLEGEASCERSEIHKSKEDAMYGGFTSMEEARLTDAGSKGEVGFKHLVSKGQVDPSTADKKLGEENTVQSSMPQPGAHLLQKVPLCYFLGNPGLYRFTESSTRYLS